MHSKVDIKIPVKDFTGFVRNFEFEIDSSFFQKFDESLISEADINLKILLEKKPELLVVNFDFIGEVGLSCDRCLDNLRYAISGKNLMPIKFSEETSEKEEIIFISKNDDYVFLDQLVYEFISLQVPAKVTCDDDINEKECNESMTKFIENPKSGAQNPFKDLLRDWKTE